MAVAGVCGAGPAGAPQRHERPQLPSGGAGLQGGQRQGDQAGAGGPGRRRPEPFGVPAYVGRHGWVSIQLATVDPTEFGELVVEAWRQTAPKRLVATYDAGRA